MKIIAREAAARLGRLLREFPLVFVVGPRQCGKSTLVRSAYPGWLHLDLERPADLGQLSADLEGFFDRHPQRVVIDEAQRLPALFPVLRHVADRNARRGRYLLLGSAAPDLTRQVAESLAGRVGILELTPFLAGELARVPGAADRWFWGGFPPVHQRRTGEGRLAWFDAYVTTYLERDLPALGLRLPAQRLRTLWTMLTHVHGALLNVSDLARSLTVSPHTVDSHLDVLESTFMIRRLPPYFANVQKRLTKAPKVYLRDTGLLHFLAGLRSPHELSTWPRRGHSFEGLVVEELIALAREQTVRPETFFWRTQAGAEVDLLLRAGRRLVPIEVKLGASVQARDIAGLRQCMKDLKLRRGFVIATTTERRTLGRDIVVVPWQDVVARQADLGLDG